VKTMVNAVALAAALFSTTAFSAPVFYNIDTFNTGAQIVSDLTANGVAVSQTVTERTLSNNLLTAVAPVSSSAEVYVAGGQGYLDIINGGGENSEVKINWNLAAGVLPANATNIGFFFEVLQSDGNPTNMSFFLNGSLLSANAIAGNTSNQIVTFGLNAAQIAAASAGGALELRINGTAGWDFSADSLGFSYEPAVARVPVPGTLALFALGLAGFTFRKKKQA
jgi:PEP-CTERM motif